MSNPGTQAQVAVSHPRCHLECLWHINTAQGTSPGVEMSFTSTFLTKKCEHKVCFIVMTSWKDPINKYYIPSCCAPYGSELRQQKWMDFSNWQNESIPTLNQRTGHRESTYKSIRNHFSPYFHLYKSIRNHFFCIFRWNNFYSTWREAAAETWVSCSFLCHDWDFHFSVLFFW